MKNVDLNFSSRKYRGHYRLLPLDTILSSHLVGFCIYIYINMYTVCVYIYNIHIYIYIDWKSRSASNWIRCGHVFCFF